MNRLILNSTSIAQWYALVNDAEALCDQRLDTDLESYLVFTLQRFSDQPSLPTSVLALEYIHSLEAVGRLRADKLRDVGDKCLLFSGFFPELAQRRNVTVSYFVDLGRQAYCYLATIQPIGKLTANLYKLLQQHFVRLLDLLLFIRELKGEGQVLNILQAEELWRNTGSQYAYNLLKHRDKNFISTKNNSSDNLH